jgi:outer membrane lipoprotein carrier protein
MAELQWGYRVFRSRPTFARARPAAQSPFVKNAIILLTLTLAPAVPAMQADSAPDVHAIAQAVDNHYNHLQTLQAQFTETYRGAGMDRTESGTLLLKKPGKMRWEYRSPKEKVFLSDGQTAWFYVPGDQQARRTPVKKLDDLRSPLAFLLGKTKLEKELTGLSAAPDVAPAAPGDIVLRGVPKALADRVSEIVLEVTPQHQIARIIIAEADGSETEYRLSEQEENRQISDQQFRFVPPPGTEVIDENFGQ